MRRPVPEAHLTVVARERGYLVESDRLTGVTKIYGKGPCWEDASEQNEREVCGVPLPQHGRRPVAGARIRAASGTDMTDFTVSTPPFAQLTALFSQRT